MQEEGPVLVRGSRVNRAASLIGGVVTCVCIAVGALFIGLRHPAPQGDRMVLLQPAGQAVAQAMGQSTRASAAAPVAQRMGRWTPSIGGIIARRAAKWLGWPYSFAGGNGQGPTYGHAVDADSRNDGHVFGFDCSGLTMYALSPWLGLSHEASAQYREAGSFHPSLDQLQPGDLIFWSPDGTVASIGHVAVYAGDGRVVQAPRSGVDVTVTPLYGVERAFMGATRPLT